MTTRVQLTFNLILISFLEKRIQIFFFTPPPPSELKLQAVQILEFVFCIIYQHITLRYIYKQTIRTHPDILCYCV